MSVFVCLCTFECRCLQQQQQMLCAGGTSGYETCDVGAEDQTLGLCTSGVNPWSRPSAHLELSFSSRPSAHLELSYWSRSSAHLELICWSRPSAHLAAPSSSHLSFR